MSEILWETSIMGGGMPWMFLLDHPGYDYRVYRGRASDEYDEIVFPFRPIVTMIMPIAVWARVALLQSDGEELPSRILREGSYVALNAAGIKIKEGTPGLPVQYTVVAIR